MHGQSDENGIILALQTTENGPILSIRGAAQIYSIKIVEVYLMQAMIKARKQEGALKKKIDND